MNLCVWPHLVSTLSGRKVLYTDKHERTHEDKQYSVVIESVLLLSIVGPLAYHLKVEGATVIHLSLLAA